VPGYQLPATTERRTFSGSILSIYASSSGS
jgi:hypothetical protein